MRDERDFGVYPAAHSTFLLNLVLETFAVRMKQYCENAMKFMNTLQLASIEVHAADIRTCVLHPASETHRQLNDEQLAAAKIDSGMVRLSVGLESVEDIIADLEQAFLGLGI